MRDIRDKRDKCGLLDPVREWRKNALVRSPLRACLDVTLVLPLLFSASMRRHTTLDGTVLCIVTFGLEGFAALLALDLARWFGFVVVPGLANVATESSCILTEAVVCRFGNQSTARIAGFWFAKRSLPPYGFPVVI